MPVAAAASFSILWLFTPRDFLVVSAFNPGLVVALYVIMRQVLVANGGRAETSHDGPGQGHPGHHLAPVSYTHLTLPTILRV